jgi:hypothetical protein
MLRAGKVPVSTILDDLAQPWNWDEEEPARP